MFIANSGLNCLSKVGSETILQNWQKSGKNRRLSMAHMVEERMFFHRNWGSIAQKCGYRTNYTYIITMAQWDKYHRRSDVGCKNIGSTPKLHSSMGNWWSTVGQQNHNRTTTEPPRHAWAMVNPQHNCWSPQRLFVKCYADVSCWSCGIQAGHLPHPQVIVAFFWLRCDWV